MFLALKLIEEIVDNSVDVATTGYKYGNKISIDITNSYIKVTDNGTGITVKELQIPVVNPYGNLC